MEFPHLPNAPATEAVLDFRVKPVDGFNVETFKSLKSTLEGEYPDMKGVKTMQVQLKLDAKPEEQYAHEDLGIAGYIFKSADGKYVAQFRRDGFTFNRMAPYTSWEDIFSRTTKLWRIYVDITRPIDVSRIAARFVNRIKIPLPLSYLEEYLTAAPQVPAEWPEVFLNAFVSKVVVQERDSGILANVTQVLENPTTSDYVPLILDIDAYQPVVFNGDHEKILLAFSGLRQMKNRIFFGSLTPKALKLFE